MSHPAMVRCAHCGASMQSAARIYHRCPSPVAGCVIFLPLFLLAACRQPHIITPPPDVYGVDAQDACHQACQKLEANGCAGVVEPGCTDNCERDQLEGVATQLDPAAVLAATTTAQLSGLSGTTCTGAP